MEYIALTKDIVQIVFWAIAGVVAILTYLHARRTILQPIKTEVFKAQLKAMSGIYGIFLGKDELQLRRDFSFKEFFDVNFLALKDAYADAAFGIKIPREDRPYNSEKCPRTLVAREEDAENSPSYSTPQEAQRFTYNSTPIYINRTCVESLDFFDEQLENPLLPITLVNLLQDYKATMQSNMMKLHDVFSEAAKEMPELYPDVNALQGSGNYWDVWDNYMSEYDNLKPKADKIVAFIRDYFMTDNLTKS